MSIRLCSLLTHFQFNERHIRFTVAICFPHEMVGFFHSIFRCEFCFLSLCGFPSSFGCSRVLFVSWSSVYFRSFYPSEPDGLMSDRMLQVCVSLRFALSEPWDSYSDSELLPFRFISLVIGASPVPVGTQNVNWLKITFSLKTYWPLQMSYT